MVADTLMARCAKKEGVTADPLRVRRCTYPIGQVRHGAAGPAASGPSAPGGANFTLTMSTTAPGSHAQPGARRSGARGRPVATSHEEIEDAAFVLFSQHGFEGTTLDMIARQVGVGRRTIHRYFPSKNDIPWGQFDQTLTAFRQTLEAMPADLPVHEAVHRGVLAFNDFPEVWLPHHRERMRLILTSPDLQAHSVLQYAAWRRVIEEYVARRLDVPVGDLTPRVIGQVSLALAMSAYEAWLAEEPADPDHPPALLPLIDAAMSRLRGYLVG